MCMSCITAARTGAIVARGAHQRVTCSCSPIRKQITDLPSYGYRRACALVNRQRRAQGGARINPKRVYRVMAQAGLLLPKAPRRRQSIRRHEDKVAVGQPDVCSLYYRRTRRPYKACQR